MGRMEVVYSGEVEQLKLQVRDLVSESISWS